MTAGSIVRRLRAALIAASVVVSTASWAGDFDLTVVYEDPYGQALPFYASIEAHVAAALSDWIDHIDGQARLEVVVRITDDVVGATGASGASAFVGMQGSCRVFEQGMAYELRTGVDPNGAAPDIVLAINPDYLRQELWFDPDPEARTAAIAEGRTDAMSIFIHEIGHALAFNGWRDSAGILPLDIASTWDEQVSFEEGRLAFTGEGAMAVYGGPVPITFAHDHHVGNAFPPGQDLQHDVMNGSAILREQRYGVSSLDLAMIQDMGIHASPAPEPATVGLVLSGLAAIALLRRRRSAAGATGRTPGGDASVDLARQ